MNHQHVDYNQIKPILAERTCGGWLATAPKWSPLRIGVTAATEAEVKEAFRVALRQWSALLADA